MPSGSDGTPERKKPISSGSKNWKRSPVITYKPEDALRVGVVMFRIGKRIALHLTSAIPRAWWEFWFDLWAYVDNDHNVKYGHVDADAGDATDAPMRDFGGVCADSGGGE